MPRFVVLQHDHPHLHWDFMLEDNGRLLTWRLSAPPESGHAILAEPIADHRLAYLDYEGPISGDRGQVVRWDFGTFTWLERDGQRIVVNLQGRTACGRFTVAPGTTGWTGTVTPSLSGLERRPG